MTDEEMDPDTLFAVLGCLGGDVYNRKPETVTWKEIFQFVQEREKLEYRRGFDEGQRRAKAEIRRTLGIIQ